MRKLNVTIECLAMYNSSIMVPSELTFDEAIEYAKKHIAEIPLGTLEYAKKHIAEIPLGTLECVSESDNLDVENCDFDD